MNLPDRKNLHAHLRSVVLLSAASWIAMPAFAGPLPTPNYIAQNLPGTVGVPSGNFENTAVTTHLYLTAWSGWTFGPSTGIVKEGQTFASSYPNIPAGAYGLFLQGGTSSATQMFTNAAGLWQLSFDAGQRNLNQKQIVRVTINGQNVFQQELDAGPLKRYSTRPFRHTGGNMTVAISGLQATGDNTAVLDDPRLDTVGAWNDAATWGGGGIPGTFVDVARIPAGVRVAIDENRTEIVGDVHVQGYLGALDGGPSVIRCRSILADGAGATFQVGTDGSKHQGDFTINLETNDTARDLVGFGNKFLGAQMGGTLDLHGKTVSSYAKLDQTVSSGNTIDVRNMNGWEIGNQIVITSTDGASNSSGIAGWLNHEVFSITNIQTINATVKRLTLSGTILRRHLAVDQSYSRTLAPAKSWTFETRAYVGLLTHNLKVQGILGTETGYGGHIMIMGAHNGLTTAGTGRLSNVELFRMGQKTIASGGLLGRYPFHWHMLASAGTGQFIKNW